MTVAVVVLAAGASERLGEPKALATLGDRAVLERLLDATSALRGDRRVAVVTGAHHDAIARFVQDRELDVDLVRNDAWAAGRTGSVACAAAARPGDDLLICPADVPLVSARAVDALAAAWAEAGAPGSGWLAPRCGTTGHYGHPVLMGRALAARAAGTPPDAPLRALRDVAQPLLAVEVDDPGVLDDLDTPDDLRRLRRRVADGRVR